MLYLPFLFLLGISIGSFLANFVIRYLNGESVLAGRSKCDFCKRPIKWYENIPVLSYFLLSGKTSCCNRKISTFYPLVEFGSGILFASSPLFLAACTAGKNCLLSGGMPISLIVYLLAACLLYVIFLIDLKSLTIPDFLTFALIAIFAVYSLFVQDPTFIARLFFAFLAALFLLFLNLITRGRGMGLGDVKLAIPLAFFFGYPNFLVWFYLAFLTGGAVALILILGRRVKLKNKIAFGPFLVIAFFLTIVFADSLLGLFNFK